MSEFPYLNNAPIKEAVIEIRLPAGQILDDNEVMEISNSIKDEYQKIETWNINEFINKVTPDGPVVEAHTEYMGLRRTNEDGTKILQIFKDRLSLSHLKPYQGWDNLKQETLKYWKIFSRIAKPTKVGRVGTRYINTVELPIPLSDFNDYLVTAPIVPEGLPQGLAHFETKVIIPNPIINAVGTVVQNLLPTDKEKNIIPVILDIDASRIIELDLTNESLEDALEDLRNYKNSLFFRHVTKRIVEKYQ